MSCDNREDPAAILARQALGAGADSFCQDALGAAKAVWLDSLICAVAGQGAPGVAAATELMRDWGGKPEAALFFEDLRLPAPAAAFVNAAMIHALDFDDVHTQSTLHIGSVVVPAVCAAAHERTAGRTMLDALVVGIETAVRIRLAGASRSQGFLPTSLAGSFGAVAAAARLENLDLSQTLDAFGLNYTQVAGNRQALLDASLAKRLQPALAVRSALWAVALAKRGISGPRRIFNGEAGFYQLYMDGRVPDAEAFRRSSGEAWEVERVSTKRYPSCGACHPVQLAAEALYAEAVVRADQIRSVDLFGVAPLVAEPFDPTREPQVAAQFSAAWAVAHTLLRGAAGLSDYTDEAVRADREVIELARSIRFVDQPPDPAPGPGRDSPELTGETAHRLRPQGLILHTRDGRRILRASSPAEVTPRRPAGWGALEAKALDCARFAGVSADAMRELVAFVGQWDRSGDAGDLYRCLSPLRAPSSRSR